MLLCDAADEAGGKLFILGGGWSVIHFPNVPVNMALAVKLSIPWDQTNRPVKIQAALVDDDGQSVEVEAAAVVRAEGELEVGRPPGLKPGMPIDAPFVLKFNGLALPAGGYVWELEIDGSCKARAPFRVLSGSSR